MPERLLVEELDAAQGDGVRGARDLLDGGQVEEVMANLFFAELVGGGMVELGELSDGTNVRLDGALGVAAQLQIIDHALAEQCHEILSENVKRVRGSSGIARHAPSTGVAG